MTDLKTIGAIVGIAAGGLALLGTVGNYFVNTTRLQDAVAGLEKARDAARDELNGIHAHEDTMAQGIVAAHQEVLLARSDITGQLGIINITVQHIRETLDEVRDVQHKHPSSLNGNGTSQ